MNATDFYKNGVPFAAGLWSTSGNDVYYNTGNIGIGTMSPSEQLEITNNARIGGTLYSATHYSLPTTTNGNHISIQAGQAGGGYDSNLIFTANGAGSIGGNLLLSAGGAGHFGKGGDVTISAGDAFDTNSQGGSILLKAKGYANWVRGHIGFFTGGGYPFDANNQSERMRIDGNGNVGIETTTPTEKLEVAGNLRVNGDFVATGTKSAVVTLADKREVAVYVVESTGNWFEDFGSATLSNGLAIVQFDSLFALIVNTGFTYHVFLTPNGNCNGLFVANKSTSGFEVRELGGGKSNIKFDYRIVARRRGFESLVSGKP